MLLKYGYAFTLAIIFCLVAACSDSGALSSTNDKTDTNVTNDSFDASESTRDTAQNETARDVEKSDDDDTSEDNDTSGDNDTSDDDATITPGSCEQTGCIDFSTCDTQTGACVCDEGYFEGKNDDGALVECVDQCVMMRCGANTTCEAGVCLCAEGYEKTDKGCMQIATGLCKDRQKPCPDFSQCDPDTGKCTCDFGEANPAANEEIGREELICKTFCDAVRCPHNQICDRDIQQCVCMDGFTLTIDGCVPVVVDLCENKQCQEHATCNTETGKCECVFGEKDGAATIPDAGVCKNPCDAMRCEVNSTCDPVLYQCVCNEGYILVEGKGCERI